MRRLMLAAVLAGMMVAGCGDEEPKGTGQMRGNVESFDSITVVSRLLAAIEGVTVHLDGPVHRSTTTDAYGNFVFTDLPAGDYTLSFVYNGEEVTYRGNSGQEATIAVEDGHTVAVTGINVSGGHVNVGNVSVVEPDEDDPIDDDEEEDQGDGPEGEDEEEDESEPEPEPADNVFYVGLAYGAYTEGWGVTVFGLIQAAIDAAPDGHIIYILPGDYRAQPDVVMAKTVYLQNAGGGTLYIPRITITGGDGAVGWVPDDAPPPDPPDPGTP